MKRVISLTILLFLLITSIFPTGLIVADNGHNVCFNGANSGRYILLFDTPLNEYHIMFSGSFNMTFDGDAYDGWCIEY